MTGEDEVGKAIPLPESGCGTMQIVVETDAGERLTLSTEHAASSYGALVLLDDQGNAHGPGDQATDGTGATCADQVRRMIAEGDVIGRLRTFAGGG